MGSMISTSVYLQHAAPAGQTPALPHAGIPQEATLPKAKGRGKGKAARPSFTNKHTALSLLSFLWPLIQLDMIQQ